jgi:hypothetical protein
MAECVLWLHRSVHVMLFIVSMLKQGPSRRYEDQPPRRSARAAVKFQKGEDLGSDKIRSNQ